MKAHLVLNPANIDLLVNAAIAAVLSKPDPHDLHTVVANALSEVELDGVHPGTMMARALIADPDAPNFIGQTFETECGDVTVIARYER